MGESNSDHRGCNPAAATRDVIHSGPCGTRTRDLPLDRRASTPTGPIDQATVPIESRDAVFQEVVSPDIALPVPSLCLSQYGAPSFGPKHRAGR